MNMIILAERLLIQSLRLLILFSLFKVILDTVRLSHRTEINRIHPRYFPVQNTYLSLEKGFEGRKLCTLSTYLRWNRLEPLRSRGIHRLHRSMSICRLYTPFATRFATLTGIQFRLSQLLLRIRTLLAER